MPDVFVSYSRQNLTFVEQLVGALKDRGKDPWFDQTKEPLEGIIAGSPWWEQIKYGVETVDNFLLIISPDSTISPYCHAEINHALKRGKRLVTALFCDDMSENETLDAISRAIDSIPEGDTLPRSVSPEPLNFRSVARQNWLAVSDIQYVVFSSTRTFEAALQELVNGLDLDFAWVRMHNRLRQAAMLWDENGRSDGYTWSDEQLKPFREVIGRRQPTLTDLERAFIRPEWERLANRLTDHTLDHNDRFYIGSRLREIGDARPGVGLRDDGLPDIFWCQVGDGETITVDIKGRISATRNLNVQYDVQTPFFIARYPVTFGQFQAFVDAEDGFYSPQWWQAMEVVKTDLESPGGRLPQQNNHPCVQVNWFDAIAFCRWLSAQLDYEITLPTEWHWQTAATLGNPMIEYPWGSEWDGRFANTVESAQDRTIAVGMYPQGESPVGALDMSGNVWEWCLNEHDNPQQVEVRGRKQRTLRGGSWGGEHTNARCAYRYKHLPFTRNQYISFRLYCATFTP